MLNKKIFRKAMAILLVFAMFASMPFTVFADTTPSPEAATLCDSINNHAWGVTATATGNTVYVSGSYNVADGAPAAIFLVIPAGVTVEWNAEITSTRGVGLRFNDGGGTLNFGPNAVINTAGTTFSSSTSDPNAVVNINGATLVSTFLAIDFFPAFVGTVNINSGTLTSNHASFGAVDVQNAAATLNMRGGTVTSVAPNAISAQNFTHTGGLINGVRATEIFDQVRVRIVSADPDPAITAVAVSPDDPTVEQGGELQFTALVSGDNFPGDVVPQGVTWSIVDSSGNPTTIDDVTLVGGLLTVGSDVPVDTEIIVRATSTEDTNFYDESTAVVSLRVVVVRIENSAIVREFVAGSQHEITFTATAYGMNNGTEIAIPNANFTWSIRDTSGNPFNNPADAGITLVNNNDGTATLTIANTASPTTEFYVRAEFVTTP